MKSAPETSYHVRRAVGGDRRSTAWIVGRFSPLLLAQARYRMGTELRRWIEAEDVVQDVWAIALPRIAELDVDSRKMTPVVLKFLSTILLHQVNHLFRTRIRQIAAGSAVEPRATGRHPDGALTSAIRREAVRIALATIDALEPKDREVIILRSLEQRPGDEVARLLGLSTSAVYVRHHRALKTLREKLPGSLFDELVPDRQHAG